MTDNQPTILVKKADGTTERITLAELKARQSGSSVSITNKVPTPTPTPSAPTPTPVPVLEPAQSLSQSTVSVSDQGAKNIVEENKPQETKVVEPVIEKPRGLVIGPTEKSPTVAKVMVQNKIVQTPLKTDDVKPLLNEPVPDSPHAQSDVSVARTDQVSKIINSLSFKVPPQFENRLRNGIQLRLKDIRGEVDTREMCLRSIKDGGLGLTQPQADELIAKTEPTPALVVKKTERDLAVDKIIGQAPATSEISDLITPKKPAGNISPIRTSVFSSTKPLVHDVQSKPVSMGPTDEIKYFSLVDLRRLSASPSEAVSRLKQKFINLRDESFLLFMDSWSAWRSSPLYQNYIEMVDMALAQKINLNSVLDSSNKITLPEIEAIMKMEKELDI